RKVNPLIPQSVENMILKSMRKNQEERYQSAKEMLRDLETCLLPERRNEPKIVFSGDDDDDEKTRVLPAIKGDMYQRSSRSGGGSYDEEDDVDRPKRKNRWIKPTVWGAVIVLLILGLWYAVGVVKGMLDIPEVDVP